MNDEMKLFLLSLSVVVLIGAVIFQRLAYGAGIRKSLLEMAEKLQAILEQDTDERLLIFTERKELQQLAGQINLLLEAHQKTRTDFRRLESSSRKMLSNISHDIRTPMTVVLGYLEILRMNGSQEDEMLKKAEKKAKDVMDLIEEFFTLAKLEASDLDLELSRLNATELCRENVLDFYELLTRNSFDVELHIPDTPIYVKGNKDAFHRILTNLISNAIRYGSDGHYLGIQLREESSFLFIDIIDKGKGIDQAFSEHVFDRLFTLEDSRSRQIQGNGLGLTIAKRLACQMGGDVTLQSTPGVQTVFTLRLLKMPS